MSHFLQRELSLRNQCVSTMTILCHGHHDRRKGKWHWWYGNFFIFNFPSTYPSRFWLRENLIYFHVWVLFVLFLHFCFNFLASFFTISRPFMISAMICGQKLSSFKCPPSVPWKMERYLWAVICSHWCHVSWAMIAWQAIDDID